MNICKVTQFLTGYNKENRNEKCEEKWCDPTVVIEVTEIKIFWSREIQTEISQRIKTFQPPLSLSCPALYSLLSDDLNDSLWVWRDNIENRIHSKETLQSGWSWYRSQMIKLGLACTAIHWLSVQFVAVNNIIRTPVFSPILSTNSQNNGAQLLTDNRHTPDHNKPSRSSTQTTPDQHWTSPCKFWRSPSSGPRWFLPWGPCPSPTKNWNL